MKPIKVQAVLGILISCTAVFSIGCAFHYAENPGTTRNLTLSSNVTLGMAWIPPGTFVMGSPPDEPFHKADESPQMQVTLTKGFWLGKTMVTIGQWKSVMGLDVRGQLSQMLHDDRLYELGGKRQTVRDFMRFSRDADPGNLHAGRNFVKRRYSEPHGK